MRVREAVALAAAVARVRLLGRRVPVFVSWAATYRCSRRCRYCRVWETPSSEMDTHTALRRVEALRAQGARHLSVTGGEPLLCEDLDHVLRRCATLGMRTSINTHGDLLPERPEVLEWLDTVTLSLDGDRAVHDALRGAGAFDDVLAAAELVHSHGRHLQVTMVLTNENADQVDAVLDLCRRLGATASFHPVYSDSLLWPDTHAPLQLAAAENAGVFAHLARVKRAEPELIRDSILSLRHLAHWPQDTAVPCVAGRLFLRMTPDGDLLACGWKQSTGSVERPVRPAEDSVAEAVAGLHCEPCRQCWNPGVVDLNAAACGRPDPILERLR